MLWPLNDIAGVRWHDGISIRLETIRHIVYQPKQDILVLIITVKDCDVKLFHGL